MRSGHCPQCGTHDVFCRSYPLESQGMEATNYWHALATLPGIELYRCSHCQYFACYGDQQRLFDSTLPVPEMASAESWRRVDLAPIRCAGPPWRSARPARECGRCGTLVRGQDACYHCGDSGDG